MAFSLPEINRACSLADLDMRWLRTSTKKQASIKEADVMEKYAHRHGELPPLNYNYNWN